MKTEEICIKVPKGHVLAKGYIQSVAQIISGHSCSPGFTVEREHFRVVDKYGALRLISAFFSGITFEEEGVLVKNVAKEDARRFFNAIALNTPGYSFSLAFITLEKDGNLFIGFREITDCVKEFLNTMKKAISFIEITAPKIAASQTEILEAMTV